MSREESEMSRLANPKAMNILSALRRKVPEMEIPELDGTRNADETRKREIANAKEFFYDFLLKASDTDIELANQIVEKVKKGSLPGYYENWLFGLAVGKSTWNDSTHQNYVDSLQMEREKSMAEEREAQERARHKRQEENRLREEERIRKMKDSWKFKYWKFCMKNLYNTNEELEKAVLEQMERDEDDIPDNPPAGGWLPFK